MSKRPKIILLCGGKGERLKPLTIDTPKPLIQINKKPIISYIFEHLESFKLDDFIIATGESHSVKEFSKLAFGYFGLDYKKHVKTDNNILTRENLTRIGDSSRLRKETGWSPTISFKTMITEMAKAETESINEE